MTDSLRIEGSDQTFAEPIWVDGIGPPLQQIEQDYRELYGEEGHYANTQRQSAKDVLALIAEVKRLRAWQAARRESWPTDTEFYGR